MFQRIGLAAVLVAAGAGVARGHDEDPRPGGKAPGSAIDVVLCLDVSNSMDQLILSAKAKLWDIVNDLARVRPAPALRVALYSYGHDGYARDAGWVRKEIDLTTDLDEINRKLNGLATRGGTELVTRVARDALVQQAWTTHPKALRLLFVCGNEPANQDTQTQMAEIAAAAKRQSVRLNCIYCGGADDADGRSWRELAGLAGGSFQCISQGAGISTPATPFDPRISELGGSLNGTYCAYGDKKLREAKVVNQGVQDSNASSLGGGVAASRAVVKAGSLYNNADWDLVDKLKADPAFEVGKLPEDQLSEDLKKLPADQRQGHLKELLAKRNKLQAEIADLNQQRQKFLADWQKKQGSAADKGFGVAMREVLKKQCGEAGLALPD